MKIADVCTWGTYEVLGGLLAGARILKVDGWRSRDWLAHPHVDVPGLWGLTLLPLGLRLPPDWASFSSAGNAVAAMREIELMRNDWHRIGQADLTKALKARLMMICSRHGAVPAPVSTVAKADHDVTGMPMQARPNGYQLQV